MVNYGDDILLLIAKIFFLGVVIFSYPVIAFPLRDGLDKLLFKKQPAPFLRSFAESSGIGTCKIIHSDPKGRRALLVANFIYYLRAYLFY